MQLREFLTERYGVVDGKAIADFARKVDCSIYAVRKWLTKERTPRSETQKIIFKFSSGKIKGEDWW